MDVRDLNISDWVLWDNVPCQVTAIGCDYIETTKCGITLAESHLLKGIPLTPEILEKIGFKFEQQGSLEVAILKMKNHHPITLEYIGWSDGRWSIREHRLVVKYVHELQHALRLCGLNKEIEI